MAVFAFDGLVGLAPKLRDEVRSTLLRTLKVTITAPGDGSEQDTGEDLPDLAVAHSVFMHVRTAEATGTTKTIDVGLLSTETGGDADGFLNDVDVSSTGLVLPGITETAGGTETHISATTYGDLIADFELGSNTAGDHGYVHPHPYATDENTAKSVSFTAGSADFAELVADLYFVLLTPTVAQHGT